MGDPFKLHLQERHVGGTVICHLEVGRDLSRTQQVLPSLGVFVGGGSSAGPGRGDRVRMVDHLVACSCCLGAQCRLVEQEGLLVRIFGLRLGPHWRDPRREIKSVVLTAGQALAVHIRILRVRGHLQI